MSALIGYTLPPTPRPAGDNGCATQYFFKNCWIVEIHILILKATVKLPINILKLKGKKSLSVLCD